LAAKEQGGRGTSKKGQKKPAKPAPRGKMVSYHRTPRPRRKKKGGSPGLNNIIITTYKKAEGNP